MSDLKALKLPDISSNVNEFEFTTKEYSKQIEIIDYISLLDTGRSSDLSREKLRPKLERINSELLDLIKQKNFLCINRK